MKTIGIIAEYNPFHNGHLYHINEIKKIYPDSLIIVILSSSFSQRGEALILNKWDRTKIILNYNVDLVVELPYPFSTESADIFAKGSIEILNHLKIDMLSFGIENDNIENIKRAAEVQINNTEFDKKVKLYLDEKYNYRSSISKAIYDLTKIKIENPNDTLSVSYVKEILTQNKSIELLPIKRTSNYIDLKKDSNIVSASNVRNKIYQNKSVEKYVPTITYDYLKNANYSDQTYFNLLKYKVLTTKNLNEFVTVDEGIENRIKAFINFVSSIDELIEKVKTKRYTSNKIRRTLCHILVGFTKEDKKKLTTIEYIRILGFNNRGKNYLSNIKKDLNVLLLTNYKKGLPMLENEIKISSIYDILTNQNTREFEYKKRPIIL